MRSNGRSLHAQRQARPSFMGTPPFPFDGKPCSRWGVCCRPTPRPMACCDWARSECHEPRGPPLFFSFPSADTRIERGCIGKTSSRCNPWDARPTVFGEEPGGGSNRLVRPCLSHGASLKAVPRLRLRMRGVHRVFVCCVYVLCVRVVCTCCVCMCECVGCCVYAYACV